MMRTRKFNHCGSSVGLVNVSQDCGPSLQHQNCSDDDCECPCHEPGSRQTTTFWRGTPKPAPAADAPQAMPCGHLTTDDVLACTPECDRINYEADGEPDGCYWCGSPLHKTSDCRQVVFSGAAYNAGYAYAAGYHD